jgi:RNA polymerase sigma factor (sigma-70 family)
MGDRRDDGALLGARERADDAFAVFYRRHVEVVLSFCARRGLTATEAADVTAETFAAALLARSRYRSESGPARAWLLGIASHKVADQRRRHARHQRALRRLAVEPVELSERDQADYGVLLARESAAPASAALSEGQRVAIYARVVEGETYEAVARELRISESVARQRVSRGLAALRVKFGKEQS